MRFFPNINRLASFEARVIVSAGILLVIAFIAILAPYLGTGDPAAMKAASRLRPPSSEWWFGTDSYGRDLYSRVLYGARVSLIVGFSVAAIATVLGLAIGLVSGTVRWLDTIIMRVTDGLMAIPSILLAIAFMALWQASLTSVIIALTVTEVPRMARLVRGVVLSARENVYVQSATAAGVRRSRIILRHILPNTLAPIVVQATYIAANSMVAEAALSFLGAGTPSGVPSWGNIIADGRALWQIQPHLIYIPAIFLSVTVLAVNMLGDTLRDILDPRMQGRS